MNIARTKLISAFTSSKGESGPVVGSSNPFGKARSALFALVVATPAAWSANPADEPKTHTLFMGADIKLQQNNEFYRVENVAGDSFIIQVNGKLLKVPTKFNRVSLDVEHHLKLTDSSVNVERLSIERAYTMRNDPSAKFVASLGAGAADAQASMDAHRMAALMISGSRGANNPNSPLGGPSLMITGVGDNPGSVEAQIEKAQQGYFASANAQTSDVNSAAHGAARLQQDLAQEMYDAIEISFEVSSEKPLAEPYAVVVAKFAGPGAKPNEVQSWVYATDLEPITHEVRRIKIKQGGFPAGFTLKSHQLHLYNRGQEVATTVSSKRVPLTRNEAFDYLLIEHLTSNKGKTLPASFAMGRMPASVVNELQLRILYIKVSEEGLPLAAFSDEACSRQIDGPELEQALQSFRFKPALEKGRAVEGVARLEMVRS